jgi:hypothetical protein
MMMFRFTAEAVTVSRALYRWALVFPCWGAWQPGSTLDEDRTLLAIRFNDAIGRLATQKTTPSLNSTRTHGIRQPHGYHQAFAT